MQRLTLLLFAMLCVSLVPLLACDAQGTPQVTFSPGQAQGLATIAAQAGVEVTDPATATGQTPGPTLTPDGGAGSPTPFAAATAAYAGSAETDKEALVAFYDATNIFDWLSGETWSSDDPLDQWPGVITNDNGRVTGLSLTGLGDLGRGLSGELPAELGNFFKLERLRLDQHLLSGEIPPELSRLSNLKFLSLRDSGLSGPIPQELGNLSSLEHLNLAGNNLSGEIPPELGNLSGLEQLDLAHNQLSGEIPPELGNLSGLENLYLGGNNLSGEIPAELWNLTNAYLSLSANQGGWCVPADQLGRWTPYESVDLADCGSPGLATATPAPTVGPRATPYPTLTPAAARDREALTALYDAAGGDHWYCNENWLSDQPLSTWCFVWTDEEGRVVDLSLVHNNLSGVIPPELGSLSSLQVLDLSDNQLSGVIPPELGSLSSLEALFLHENQLNGEIPPELGNLSSLAFLHLNYNDLSTDMPPELGGLLNLKVLRIDGTWAISGCVPAALEPQLDMERSDLQDVPFCGDASTPTPVADAVAAPEGAGDVELPWTQDGLTAIEREALGYLETIRQDDLVYEALVSGHPWLSSGIGEEERRFLCLVVSIAESATRYAAVLAEEPSADLPECGAQ